MDVGSTCGLTCVFLYVFYPITGLHRLLGVQEIDASKISRQSAHEGGKLMSPKHGHLYLPGHIPGTDLW